MGYWQKKEIETNNIGSESVDCEEKTSLEDVERESLAELSDVEKSFRSRMKNENKRFLDMCDTEYWFCVCFTSRAQKEEFLERIGIETDLKYIDGREMAKAFRKSIKTPDIEFARIRAFDKEYLNRSDDLGAAARANPED